jgi:Spy/CpxP family protein refolding chaperone
MRLILVLFALAAAPLFAQMPKGIYSWWSRPEIARNLNLSAAQREQIRATVQQFRPHLVNVRSEVEQAEQALVDQFNSNPVNPGKTNEAIERLVDARSDLTRTISQLSLKLRLVLTEEQWQELQRQRPNQGSDSNPANKSDQPSQP